MTNAYTPLAARMRPRNFDEFVGQEHIIGKGKALRELIERDQLSSLILWGPPGCGKTSLAYLIASVTKSHFEYLSAVEASLEDLRKIIKEAKNRLLLRPDLNLKFEKPAKTPQIIPQKTPQRTILTIDEVHRWNRAQQAVLLPYVEDGTIVFIGCTTENPYFEVIGPLVSRSSVYKLEPLSDSEIEKILKNALKNKERGLFEIVRHIKMPREILDLIIQYSNGDARRALNILEAGIKILTKSISNHDREILRKKPGNEKQKEVVTKIIKEIIEEVIQRRTILYDKDRDAHYDTISAFIKSMRGSDPDAAVFYLVKMLEAGEDPKFIARRIMILASEDIGNADPNAINVAASAFSAVEKVGLPEAEFALAQAAIYMACAPKSNAIYRALAAAKKDLNKKGVGGIPLHLRNAPHPGLKKHGYGENYKYPHSYKEGFVVEENYLPKHLRGTRYYQPSERGYEKIIKARLDYWRKLASSSPKKDMQCKIKEREKNIRVD